MLTILRLTAECCKPVAGRDILTSQIPTWLKIFFLFSRREIGFGIRFTGWHYLCMQHDNYSKQIIFPPSERDILFATLRFSTRAINHFIKKCYRQRDFEITHKSCGNVFWWPICFTLPIIWFSLKSINQKDCKNVIMGKKVTVHRQNILYPGKY